MTEVENFEVEVRAKTGTGAARAERREGLVPGTLFGGGLEPVSVTLPFNQVLKAYRAGRFQSKLAKITHEGKQQDVIAREVQVHPVKGVPIHVDLMRVDENTMINVEVQVRFLNEESSPGVKRGGVLNIVRHAVELRCPATRIPNHLEADLDGLDIGDSIHISAIALPDGVTPTITDRDFTVATVAPPSGGAEGTEPGEEGEEGEALEAGAEGEAGEGDGDGEAKTDE